MLCPICGVELRILATETVVTGDTSAATPTRVVARQRLRCPNPACHSKTDTLVDHELYRSAPAEKTEV